MYTYKRVHQWTVYLTKKAGKSLRYSLYTPSVYCEIHTWARGALQCIIMSRLGLLHFLRVRELFSHLHSLFSIYCVCIPSLTKFFFSTFIIPRVFRNIPVSYSLEHHPYYMYLYIYREIDKTIRDCRIVHHLRFERNLRRLRHQSSKSSCSITDTFMHIHIPV